MALRTTHCRTPARAAVRVRHRSHARAGTATRAVSYHHPARGVRYARCVRRTRHIQRTRRGRGTGPPGPACALSRRQPLHLSQPDEVRERDPKAKQGSKATPVEESEEVHRVIAEQTRQALQTYKDLLASGVAPEVARGILPQSMYTEFVETGSLAAYARLCHLRLGADAQKEIRMYAGLVNDILEAAFPVSWKALQQTF